VILDLRLGYGVIRDGVIGDGVIRDRASCWEFGATIKGIKGNKNLIKMWKNYFKVAYRNLWKNKVFSLINILGLAIGMAACLLILKYVYRISEYAYLNGELVGKRAQTAPALAPALKREIPEVKQSARLVHTAPLMSDPVLQVGDRSFHEDKIYFADASFLEMFSYPMSKGNRDNALVEPGKVVLSNAMADKYFPGQDALGQTLTFHMGERGNTQLKITGIFSDIPENSHVHTDFMISFSSIPWNLDENWDWGNFYSSVELVPERDLSAVKSKISAVLEKYRGETLAEWRKAGYNTTLDLQPIQSIHLDSDLEAEAEANGSRRTIGFLTLVAIFILVIAWINYINLSTAKSIERSKEIGIRKVVGSSRKQLIAQLMTESFLVNALAALLAILLSQLLLPAFQSITNGEFTTTLTTGMSMVVTALFFTGSFFSGLFPAFVLSSFQPLQMIKGSLKSPERSIPLRGWSFSSLPHQLPLLPVP
jgi:putative ABC transport system permease protein